MFTGPDMLMMVGSAGGGVVVLSALVVIGVAFIQRRKRKILAVNAVSRMFLCQQALFCKRIGSSVVRVRYHEANPKFEEN